MHQGDSAWFGLVVDDAASPRPLDEPRYVEWLARQRAFVSSVMDAEMTPYRAAMRAYLASKGAAAEMWETLVPQDQAPETAYLQGVDRSTLFILILGNRYGVADDTGYSPTHKEANRATARHLPRLLFTLQACDRDGRLVDWLNSLHAVLSGVNVETPDHAVERLDATLRELAARVERSWIKLGRYVFPGRVSRVASPQTGERFVVTARVASDRVRHGLLGLISPFGMGTMPLTWPNHSCLVQVDEVASESEFAAEEAVKVTCRGAGDTGASLAASIGTSDGRTIGPVDQAELWARRAILNETIIANDGGFNLLSSSTRPDCPTLAEVLASIGASGWLAEGLARLYVVEETYRRWGGLYDHLQVGFATATSLAIDGEFRLDGVPLGRERARVSGMVSLAQ